MLLKSSMSVHTALDHLLNTSCPSLLLLTYVVSSHPYWSAPRLGGPCLFVPGNLSVLPLTSELLVPCGAWPSWSRAKHPGPRPGLCATAILAWSFRTHRCGLFAPTMVPCGAWPSWSRAMHPGPRPGLCPLLPAPCCRAGHHILF